MAVVDKPNNCEKTTIITLCLPPRKNFFPARNYGIISEEIPVKLLRGHVGLSIMMN